LRYKGTPSLSLNDNPPGITLNSVTIVEPQSGDWYLLVVPATLAKRSTLQAVNYEIRFQPTICPDLLKRGPYCNVSVAVPNMSKLDTPSIATANAWVYYQANITVGVPYNITVKATDQNIQPQVYVTRDQLPNMNNKVISGCNSPYCTYATVIQLTLSNTTNNQGYELWYVGVTSPNTTTFGIWFGTACAPGCQSPYGTCSTDPASYGQCSCTENLYLGLDCRTPNENGLQAQYIVLIIIASLVVVSAIIGFIAWAYMRRKRVGYEKVA